jgi:hypothetical protein
MTWSGIQGLCITSGEGTITTTSATTAGDLSSRPDPRTPGGLTRRDQRTPVHDLTPPLNALNPPLDHAPGAS